jgi:trimethylamine--corrinoid protein Co-methyltransferase
MANRSALNIPRLRILSEDKIDLLHEATLKVLRRTGVAVKDATARETFKKGGCLIEEERVRIPSHLVESALRNTPSCITLCDRNGEPSLYLENNNAYFGTGSDTPNVVDPFTGERRKATYNDIEMVSQLIDYLPELSFIMSSGIASDVNPRISDLYHFMAMASNTEKPIVFTSWSVENLRAIIEMGELIAGGESNLRNRPFIALYTEPISPLTLAVESAQKLMVMAQKSLPIIFTPGLLTGATGPVTIAGGLIQANAEMLSGYVLANLLHEGVPFVYGGAVLPLDMRASLMSYASPEFMLATSALTDMARYYKLPMFSFAGCSDSNTFDQQATLESALWILLSSLNGGNLIHDVGYINNGLTTSFDQIVVSNEVIALVRHITGGLEINEDTMAIDLIDEIGPGGEYLTSDHTLKHFRKNFYPDLLSREPYERWEENGKKDLGERSKEKVRHILKNYTPHSLDKKLRDELQKIVDSMD